MKRRLHTAQRRTRSPEPPYTGSVSKIGRLPEAVREEILRRLRDGYSGRAILTWLNSKPVVRRTLCREFPANPTKRITAQNLSEFRLKYFPPLTTRARRAGGVAPETHYLI